jgi:hypothetical protein
MSSVTAPLPLYVSTQKTDVLSRMANTMKSTRKTTVVIDNTIKLQQYLMTPHSGVSHALASQFFDD